MRGILVLSLALIFSLTVGISQSLAYYRVIVDVSSISGSEFELEFSLYDHNWNNPSGTTGDSYVLIDNVFIRDSSGTINPPGLIDFEDGTNQGFNEGSLQDSNSVCVWKVRLFQIFLFLVLQVPTCYAWMKTP